MINLYKMTMKKSFIFAAVLLLAHQSYADEFALTVSDLAIEAGGTGTLYVRSDVNTNATPFSAFQFDLLLPEGLEMPYVEGYGFGSITEETYFDEDEGEEVTKKVFTPAFTSSIAVGGVHTIACSAIKGGYRFVCSTMSFTTFQQSKVVLKLTLNASKDAVNGTYPITLGGEVMFTTPATEGTVDSSYPSIVSGKCTITGGASTATIPFTMTDAGWGTLIVPFDANIPSGLTAYTCGKYSSIDEVNWLDLQKAESLTANTPYIVSGVAGDYSFAGTPNAENPSYTNGLLTGVYVATSIDHGYVLQKQSEEVAFFKVANGKPKTVSAYRCYLNDQPSGSTAFYFGGTTQIENVLNEVEPGDGIVYDLQGRRCEGTLKSGVYIRNEQLFYVK